MSLGKRLLFLQGIVAAFVMLGIAILAYSWVTSPSQGGARLSVRVALMLEACGLAAMGWGTYLLARTIHKPIRDTVLVLRDIVSGDFDLTRRLPNWRCDELGDLNKWFNEFIQKQQDLMVGVRRSVERLEQSSKLMHELSVELEKESDSATEKSSVVSDSAAVMKAALDETLVAAQRLLDAMNRIRDSAGAAANESKDAATAACGASETMSRLGAATTEIRGVVKLISTIAEQTNLLSLNATIEAARAGELGKGFAVVATEVKELAKGSASATVDINQRINSIQSGSDDAITAIECVRTLNERLSDSAANVLSAAEQQDTECKLIVEHVSRIKERSDTVSANIQDLEAVSQASSERALRAKRTSNDLGSISNELQSLVAGLRVSS